MLLFLSVATGLLLSSMSSAMVIRWHGLVWGDRGSKRVGNNKKDLLIVGTGE